MESLPIESVRVGTAAGESELADPVLRYGIAVYGVGDCPICGDTHPCLPGVQRADGTLEVVCPGEGDRTDRRLR